MQVQIFTHDAARDGEDYGLKGTITWDGNEYILHPSDSLYLENVLHRTLHEGGNFSNREIDASEPEEFLKNLAANWRSSYSYCTPATSNEVNHAAQVG